MQVIFKYTAQQEISQSHHHIGVPMSIDETQRQTFGVKVIIPTLALLMLLGAGCSEKDTTPPEEDASAVAPAPQAAETAAPPAVKVPEPIAEPGEPKAVTEPNVSRSAVMKPEAIKAFVPTHTVKTNLNLRPSPSLNTAPIAVLKAGSEVEYIKEDDDWYYVNTQLHGKGWCSSKYLTSLLQPKNK
jgi:glucose/arabinose dehydrogenase